MVVLGAAVSAAVYMGPNCSALQVPASIIVVTKYTLKIIFTEQARTKTNMCNLKQVSFCAAPIRTGCFKLKYLR